jgi:hypothetical protein
LTAGNSIYLGPLQYTVYLVHKNYPDYKFIIYDLGLTPEDLILVRKPRLNFIIIVHLIPLFFKKTKENCKCEVKEFDPDKIYASHSPHIRNPKTYAWKPLIIQV